MSDREKVGLCTRDAFVTSNLAIPGQIEGMVEVRTITLWHTILTHPEVNV